MREFEEIREQASGELPQRARAFADHWMARVTREPDFLVLTLEFLVHAWRNPSLREAFGHRAAFGRLAIARILADEADEDSVPLPMPAEELATVLRELGTGLGLAKLADPDAIPDHLFGDFVELFLRLATRAGHDELPRRRERE